MVIAMDPYPWLFQGVIGQQGEGLVECLPLVHAQFQSKQALQKPVANRSISRCSSAES